MTMESRSALPEARVVLRSYGGVGQRCSAVERPDSESALREVLLEARKEGRKVSFRTGERAFDTQSLNTDVVVYLDRFRRLEVNAKQKKATAGAGVTWGEILEESIEEGLVPYVVVTSSYACVGGTLSSNSYSRFSPTCGREGSHVESFRFMTLDGNVLTCSRTENARLFRAVLGGLGYLGAVLEVTFALHDLGSRPPDIGVQTEFTPFVGLGDVAEKLTERVCATCSAEPSHPRALSAAVYMNAKRQGFIMESEYVRRRPRFFEGISVHNPNRLGTLFLQLLALFRPTRRLGWWAMLNFVFRNRRVHVDPLVGYTFFQDGNERLHRLAHALRIPIAVRQQTYFIPYRPGESDAGLRSFLDAADAHLDSNELLPAMIDIVYLRADPVAPLLSAGSGQSGFVVTVSFEALFRTDMSKEEAALTAISRVCREHGGCVHLVKHVFADPALIRAMYEPNLEEFKSLKSELDPDGILENEFLRRVLPDLVKK